MGYIVIVQHKEHFPEVLSIPPGTPCIVKNNYIPYNTFTIITVQLHVSAINVDHLQVVHEAPYDELYLYLIGGTVRGVGWVRDLVLCL